MIDELKRKLMQKPFVPFRLALRDGRRLDVSRPFQVGLGLTRFAYAPLGLDQFVQEHLGDIVSLDVTPAGNREKSSK